MYIGSENANVFYCGF